MPTLSESERVFLFTRTTNKNERTTSRRMENQ